MRQVLSAVGDDLIASLSLAMLVILIAFGALYVLVRLQILTASTAKHSVAWFCLGASVCVVIATTLSPTYISDPHNNSVPLISLIRPWLNAQGRTTALVNLIGNLLLFALPAFFASIATPSLRRLGRLAMWGAAFALVIELAQALLHNGRSADVNDLIVNTLGAVLGGVIAAMCQYAVSLASRHHRNMREVRPDSLSRTLYATSADDGSGRADG